MDSIKRTSAESLIPLERILLNYYKEPQCALQGISASWTNLNHFSDVRQSSPKAPLCSPDLDNGDCYPLSY